MDNTSDFIRKVIIFGFLGLLYFVSAIINGYTFSVLWGWFIVPTFGVPNLSIASAIGITLGASILTQQTQYEKEDPGFGIKIVIRSGKLILKALVVLIIGWIVHQFM